MKINSIFRALCVAFFTLAASRSFADVQAQNSLTADSLRQEVAISPAPLSEKDQKSLAKKLRRDSIRSTKKVWTSILGGPSYTPEASVGVGGALLMSFRLDPADTISQRSFVPVGFNLSINGTVVVAGSASLFFKENSFRIYSKYSFRNEPANFYGVGIEAGDNTPRTIVDANGEEIDNTIYNSTKLQFFNRFIWELKEGFYLGPLFDLNYAKASDLKPWMLQSALNDDKSYFNAGLGAMVQYDTRDDVATPHKGYLLSALGKVFGHYLGGNYNYQNISLEYRQFQPILPRATLGWVLRTDASFGDVPVSELPSFGSPFDLRGFYMGQYRDKAMGYGIVEYRQMFGSMDAYERGKFYSKLGFVAWAGAGSVAPKISELDEWRYNYGLGLRIQLQPRKNFRVDVGRGQGGDGWLFYMNMTEAF